MGHSFISKNFDQVFEFADGVCVFEIMSVSVGREGEVNSFLIGGFAGRVSSSAEEGQGLDGEF